jgi:RNA polymerase sigma-70 factor (ECF subfamily)
MTAGLQVVSEEAAETAVPRLFRAHFNDVYRMVAHLLGPGASPSDIEDLTQQVFIAAHRGWSRYRGEGQVTTWLYGIASRVVLSNLRSWRRHRRLITALQAEPLASDRAPLEQRTEAKQELTRVWQVLMCIKPKKRIVYVLHVVEERSGEEIAEILNIPVATVWTRLHHARKELAARMDRKVP